MFGAVEHVRGRVTGVRRPYIDIAWVDPPRALHRVLSDYLLATDATLTPALLRASGLAVGSIEQAVTYDYARRRPTTRRCSRCACAPTRRTATSPRRRSPTCARRSTPTRGT